jgi:ABC-type transport system involved in multi-copper enzyme maturation permease subunit
VLDLIYKDIIQNRKLILLYALIGGFVGLVMMASGSDGGGIFTAYVMVSTYGFAVRSTYDEDKSGAYLFLKSLPLSDAAIVTSKFVSVLAVSVLLVIFFNVTAVLGAYLASLGIIPGLGSSAASPRLLQFRKWKKPVGVENKGFFLMWPYLNFVMLRRCFLESC